MGYEQNEDDPQPGVWRELDALVDEVQRARAAVAAAQSHEAAVLARAVELVEARTYERRAQGIVFGNDLPLREVSAELGTAMRVGDLPAPLVHAIMDRLNEFARSVDDARRQEHEDGGAGADAGADADPVADADTDADADTEPPRTLGEIRADVLADLLLTSTPTGHHGADGDALTGIRGQVSITIPLTTAAGVDEQPALLGGYGPVDADLARCLMAKAPAWNLLLVDISTGAPVAVTRYRPSAQLQRFVDLRDERCRFPGCTVKPWRCDADHTIDAALGGETSACNLADLCRRHHVLKHSSPWRVEQVGGGRLRWTSPTGRVYDDHVPATLRFMPTAEHVHDGDPPPF